MQIQFNVFPVVDGVEISVATLRRAIRRSDRKAMTREEHSRAFSTVYYVELRERSQTMALRVF